MVCERCRVDYPSDILHALVVNGRSTAPICGQCALEVTNDLHGLTRNRFDGRQADAMRRDAVDHRRRTKQTPVEPRVEIY